MEKVGVNNMQLTDREWKEFFIKDIFNEVKRGKRLTKSNQAEGVKPYVSSSALTNGVDNFISNSNNVREFADCISLANSGSVGSSFYHPYSFIASDHITHLKNKQFNKYIYLFISTLTKRLSEKYNFNREINDTRISKEKILLPIDKNDDPDYYFMEAYVKEQEDKKKQEYIAYAKNAIARLEHKGVPPLSEKEWSEFRVLDLFDYKRGNQNNMNSLIEGFDMLISAKNINNGLKGFCKSNNDRKTLYQGDCITLNNDGDGGVGLAYYQPYKFLLDTHVYALYSKTDISRYAKLYITLALSKQRICFSHGRSISKERLEKIKIMLPINEKEQPDYEYMEQYTKNIEYKKLMQYLDYLNSK